MEEDKKENIEDKKETKVKKKKWLPLESNYYVMNKYVAKLGASTDYVFGDIYGFGEELLWVPRPCVAVLLVFPINEKNEKTRKEEEATFKNNKISPNVFYIKQTIGNACGTIGLLHAVLNNTKRVKIGSHLSEFHQKTQKMSPLERAKFLEEFKAIEDVHDSSATDTKTVKLKKEDEKTWNHFICFVEVDGNLYELDGRRDAPLNRGKTSDFLLDVAVVIKDLVKVTGNPYQFAATFYSKKQ